jgi:hypothetical protein
MNIVRRTKIYLLYIRKGFRTLPLAQKTWCPAMNTILKCHTIVPRVEECIKLSHLRVLGIWRTCLYFCLSGVSPSFGPTMTETALITFFIPLNSLGSSVFSLVTSPMIWKQQQAKYGWHDSFHNSIYVISIKLWTTSSEIRRYIWC